MTMVTVATMTTNADTAAIPVIPGNTYALDLSGTFGSSTTLLKQCPDGTNYRTHIGFTGMTVAGTQTFVALGENIKFNNAGGTSQSVVAKLADLGGPASNLHQDFSKYNRQSTRTNS